MKILFCILFGFLLLSCNDKTVEPTPDSNPCDVPKYNQYTLWLKGIGIYDVSRLSNYILFNKLRGNDSEYDTVFLMNTKTQNVKPILINNFIQNNFAPPYVKILACPYDEDIVLLELFYRLSNNSGVYSRFYKYTISNEQISEVTPVEYLQTGIPLLSNRDKIWMNSSSPNNDYFTIIDNGIYHFQTWEQIKPPDNSVFQYAISNSGNYEIVRKKNDTMISFNGVEITNSNQFKRIFQFSPDEKYFTYIEDIRFDTLNPFTFVQKLHIYDVEKTLSSGKAVLYKTIDLPKDLCAFQFANYVVTPKNTIYISMSRFDFMPMTNLYEIDFNGKILRQLTNE